MEKEQANYKKKRVNTFRCDLSNKENKKIGFIITYNKTAHIVKGFVFNVLEIKKTIYHLLEYVSFT